jgi:hypothetical protein
VLLLSPSRASANGMADYATEFVCTSRQIRAPSWGGGVTILHGVPFLFGGTSNTAATRTMVETEHWVNTTGNDTDGLFATCITFIASLHMNMH